MNINSSRSSFIVKLKELAKDKKNRNIYEAIRAWCNVIPFITDNSDKEITDKILASIKEWKNSNDKDKILQLATDFLDIRGGVFSGLKPASVYISDRLNKIEQDSKNSHYQEDKEMYNMIVLLVAFVLVGTALLFYLFNQGQNKEQKQTFEQDQYGNASPVTSQRGGVISPNQEKYILILVIDASKKTVLQSLRENKKIALDDSQALYEATKALLIVKKSDFDKNAELSNWFLEDRAVQAGEISEYDVHLIKIGLYQDDAGFGKNANSAARYEAFRSLSQMSGKVGEEIKVSPRLPSAAYKNIGVYQ